MTDTRIAYGARCVWWGSIQKVGNRKGLPCCPECGGVLYEMPNEAAWFEGVDRHDERQPGYRKFIEWLRGKCYPSYGHAKAAYEAREVSND